MSFAACAARLSGLASVVLGWRPAEFWAATPEELALVLAALMPDAGDQPVTAVALSQLQEQYPDG